MPTIIDELAMTLKLDPAGFSEGAEKAESSSDNLLTRMLANLAAIERATQQTATNTAAIQQRSGEETKDTANRTADAQATAARRGGEAQEEAAKKALETQRKVASQMEEAFSKTAGSIKRVGIELLSLFGVAMSVSAIERLFSGIMRTNEQAAQLSRNIGVNVETLTTWQGAAARMGGTAEDTASAMGVLTRERLRWKTEGKSDLPFQMAAGFGVNIMDDKGEMLRPEQIALALGDAVDRRKGTSREMSPEAIKFWLDKGNLGGLAPQVQSGGAEMRKQLELQQRTGNVTTEKDKQDALDLGHSLDLVQQSAMGLSRVFWRQLGPAINDIVDRIGKWIEKNRDWLNEKAADWGKRLASALQMLAHDFDLLINGGAGKFATTIGEIAHTADQAAQAVGGWRVVMETFALFWISNKITGAIASIRGLTMALTGLGAVGGGSGGALTMALGRLNPIIALLIGTYELLANVAPAVFGERPLPVGRPPKKRADGTDGPAETQANVAGRGAEGNATPGVGPHHGGNAPAQGGTHGGGRRFPVTPTPAAPTLAPAPALPSSRADSAAAASVAAGLAPGVAAAIPTAPAEPTFQAPAAPATEPPRPGGSASLTDIGTPVEGPVAPAGGGFAGEALTSQFNAAHGGTTDKPATPSTTRPGWVPNWVPEFDRRSPARRERSRHGTRWSSPGRPSVRWRRARPHRHVGWRSHDRRYSGGGYSVAARSSATRWR